MLLGTIDWVIVFGFFVISMLIGILVARKSGENTEEFFLSGRTMPWWLLGVSMVATTFSTDTPNLVTDIVRTNGVAGNWSWWAFLLTGMLTVFVYAKLWRRSKVFTDVEFYELRYSGHSAAFLRGFRAIYLGVFFNIMIMASVSVAAKKIGGVMLGMGPVETVVIAGAITVIYSMIGGFRGVIWTDFFQFAVAMGGSVFAAFVALDHPKVNGLANLLANPSVSSKLSFLPDFSDTKMLLTLLIIPLAVQWWSVWYPGAEPGGGGYIAQRMLSAKDEKNAITATLFFNACHYALRPWPWIIVALCSIVVFPELSDIRAAFPQVDESLIKNDLAYSAMLTFLPKGAIGLVVASLIAAYMSTISTHLNWGSSYVVNDFWLRFVKPQASQRELVWVGRISTLLLMFFSCIVALLLSNALQAFNILLQIGAGTGLLFILRWFWWRINAYSEIAAMVVSFAVAVYFAFVHERLGLPKVEDHWQLVIGVVVTTICWAVVTFLTPPTESDTLRDFVRRVHPGGPGWKKVIEEAEASGISMAKAREEWDLPVAILCMVLGCFAVYGALFATGFWIYGNTTGGVVSTVVAVVATAGLLAFMQKLKLEEDTEE
ncbi:Na+:solute symporter [Candidatus Sumerlaeota bacterium]|nr:Na+:solute symporter [Candidatus Sumerlaeota bacterium]